MDTNLKRPLNLFMHPVRYEIPSFQRRYVWSQDDQWEPLWEDVEKLAQSILEGGKEPTPHFMGAIVLQQVPNPAGTIERRIVVDGQQRLTTIQILIDAIQEVLGERQYTDPAMRLAGLVENPEVFRGRNPDNAFKIWPTSVDRGAFRCAMSNDMPATDHAANRIVQAHDYFRGQAEVWLDKFSDGPGEHDKAAPALESAVHNLELVVIDLGKADDPHIIFETLNARGTPLLQSDMVKNYILYQAGVTMDDDDQTTLEQQRRLWPFDENWWAKEEGRGNQKRPRIDLYLNHWLTLRNRREMKAYDEFRAFERYAKAWMEAGKTIDDVAQDMAAIRNIYRDVEEVRRMDIARFLERRNVMNVGTITPLLLWLLSADIPQGTLTNCLRALESFLVRRVVCGYHSRSYGDLFVRLLAKLAEEPPGEADRILVSFLAGQTAPASLWPHDPELLGKFITAPLYQWLTRTRLRMVLEGIEEELRTEMAEEKEAPRSLQIEHILPQAWNAKNWPLPEQDDGEAAFKRRERAIHTIGNLTLVTGKLNKELSNASWDNKRKALDRHSVLVLNRHLVNTGDRQVWDADTIEERAKWLYGKAVRIWPSPDAMGR